MRFLSLQLFAEHIIRRNYRGDGTVYYAHISIAYVATEAMWKH